MSPKVAIVYKRAKTSSDPKVVNPYHAGGLAANALHTVAVLKEMGVDAVLKEVADYAELRGFVQDNLDITELVVEAVWLTVPQVHELALRHPRTKIVVRAHSKMGFLQVEPEAITVMINLIKLSESVSNIQFSSNNEEFAGALQEVYGGCLYLPNLYDLASAPKRSWLPETLKIASFGATRLLKLHPPAALAALQIGAATGRSLEFYINVDKTPGGDSVRQTIRNMFKGVKKAKLIEVGWQDTQTFKETIASMDLVIQLSATETFCLVAADAIASGVPVIGSYALTWLPAAYQVNGDDTTAVAAAGVDALKSGTAAKKELKSLTQYVDTSKNVWRNWLGIQKKKWWK
jgi:glycosyltransferase involved in cell wall biosynthesis